MRLPRVYYLERSPFTGELQSVDDSSGADDFYRPGELYVLVDHNRRPARSYAVQVVTEGLGIVDDRLDLVAGTLYALRFSGSKLQRPKPMFEARRAGSYGNALAWRLIELNPDYLDELELKHGYNVVGDTSVG